MTTAPSLRELDLTPDRLPKSVWFAAGPPIFAAILLYWLRIHWHEFPSVYPPESGKMWHESSFRSVLRGEITFTAFGLWTVAQGIAMWYGSARTPAHRAHLELAVATSCTWAFWTPAINLGNYLDLSWRGYTLCGLCAAAGLASVIVFALRARRSAGTNLESIVGEGYYFDRHDPAVFGPRGMNMGNPWQWALAAGMLVTSAIPFLLP